MKIKKEDTLFVGNDCLYRKSNRHLGKLWNNYFKSSAIFLGEKMISLEKPIVFLYANNDKEKIGV